MLKHHKLFNKKKLFQFVSCVILSLSLSAQFSNVPQIEKIAFVAKNINFSPFRSEILLRRNLRNYVGGKILLFNNEMNFLTFQFYRKTSKREIYFSAAEMLDNIFLKFIFIENSSTFFLLTRSSLSFSSILPFHTTNIHTRLFAVCVLLSGFNMFIFVRFFVCCLAAISKKSEG